MMKNIKIAIDGPAGVGKSTIAKLLSKKLDIVYIDSGAAYRAATYYFLKNNMEVTRENIESNLENIHIDMDKEGIVFLNGEDVTCELRTKEVSNYVSTVSARVKKLRERLVILFRKLAENESVVMDGRDITSVVFPDADLKLYLETDLEVKVERRYKEYLEKGETITLEEVRNQIIQRDNADLNGENKGLIKVPNAVVINTSYKTPDELVNDILKLLNDKNVI